MGTHPTIYCIQWHSGAAAAVVSLDQNVLKWVQIRKQMKKW